MISEVYGPLNGPWAKGGLNMEKHPFLKIIDGLYGKNNISILGLNSEFINSISENQYNIYTIN